MITLHDLEAGSKVKFDTCKGFADHDFLQVVFSFQTPAPTIRRDSWVFLYDPAPPYDIKDVIWQPFCFQNKAKTTVR